MSSLENLPRVDVRSLPLWREFPYFPLFTEYISRPHGETGETGETGDPTGDPIGETGETGEPSWTELGETVEPVMEKPEKPGKPEKWIKERVEKAVALKHRCRLRAARGLFVALALERPAEVQVWLEFVRFEMECGEFRNAERVLTAGLTLHPASLPLLQRQIRIAERLRLPREIESASQKLRSVGTQRALKASLDAFHALARLGFAAQARDSFASVLQQPGSSAGNFVLEFLEFEASTAGQGEHLRRALGAVEEFPKYGPLWFYTLERLEHVCLLQWEACGFRGDVVGAGARGVAGEYVRVARRAARALTQDVLWRAFFFRMQFFMRCLMCLQRAALKQVGDSPRNGRAEGRG